MLKGQSACGGEEFAVGEKKDAEGQGRRLTWRCSQITMDVWGRHQRREGKAHSLVLFEKTFKSVGRVKGSNKVRHLGISNWESRKPSTP